MDEAMNQIGTFVELMLRSHLHNQSRLNYSLQDIVENFEIRWINETKMYGEQINTLLKSISSKIEECSVNEKNRQCDMELIQFTLHQEQKRFNQPFDLFTENRKLRSYKIINCLTCIRRIKFTYNNAYSHFSYDEKTCASGLHIHR